MFRKVGEISEPTEADLQKDERAEVIEKAKNLGLNEEEIEILQEAGKVNVNEIITEDN